MSFSLWPSTSLSLSLLPAAGYIIYYSTDVNAEVHDWVIEPVVGNRLTHQIQELTLDTAYYFKIQARNSKGMGPMSEAVQFRTPKSKASFSYVQSGCAARLFAIKVNKVIQNHAAERDLYTYDAFSVLQKKK